MDDALRWQVRPELRDPACILAFDGWNDAAEAATTVARYVSDAVRSVPLAEIDPEPYFDFTVRRPEVRFGENSLRKVEWPNFAFRYGSAGPDRDLVIGIGPEPHFRWRDYCSRLSSLLADLGVRRVVLLGAHLADVLYSRPVRIAGFASAGSLLESLDVTASGYEGPTGIVGVLGSLLTEEGFEVLSLWAGLPHYIEATPNPRGALALLQKLTQHLDIRLDDAPLQREAADFENRISAMVASDPALSEYIRDLKRREFAQ